MASDWKAFCAGAILGGAVALGVRKLLNHSGEAEMLEYAMRLSKKEADGDSGTNESEPDSEVSAEQFIRNEQFFGAEGQSHIRKARVIVVGVGGVGSHCAVALARSGIGSIRLIDFDRVTVSSLNRHASAVRSEVGITKVDSLKRYIKEFSPECKVDAVEALFKYEFAEDQISAFSPDWVVDAIDNLQTKSDLLAYCYQNKIRVISACGSAAKCDPTRIRIAALETTSEDSLARAIRQRLRLNHNLSNTGIPVVYSIERTTRGLLPLKDFQEENPKEYQTLENFRVRILPVIAPLPAIMGNAIASYVLCNLANQPFDPLSTSPLTSSSVRKKLWHFMRKNFACSIPDSTEADAILDIVYDACSGRSVVSNETTNLCIAPWRRLKVEKNLREISPLDLVLLTTSEAKALHGDQIEPLVFSDRFDDILARIKSNLEAEL